MKLKNIILGLGLSLLMNTTFAQGGLEGIVVERYYQTDASDGANASTNGAINALTTGTVVYRVYVDMAAGYKFSQLYGTSAHDFKLNTTTNFYNDPNYSVATEPNTISLVNAKKHTALIDSWFTLGGVCVGKSGVLKTEDTDGSIGNTQSILDNNPGACYGSPINGANAQDGLVASTILTAASTSANTFQILGITSSQLALLNDGSGNSFLSNGGSISALGGIKGTNASNMVLVGQFTTSGVLSFEFNVQLIAANGTSENWVAKNRTGNEYTSASLIFNSSAPTASNQSFCTGNSPTVANLVASGSGIKWYTDPTGGTELSAGTALVSDTYYASQTFSGCEGTNRTAVVVTVNTTPVAPTTEAQSFCTATVGALTATAGTAIKWYTAATGGSALASTSALASGNYYATQTVAGCESTTRALTAITINAPAAPTTTAAQSFCSASAPTVANLAATGTAIKWYSASTGGSALSTTTALGTGNYFASQTVGGCESATRTVAAVTVKISPAVPTTTATQSFCSAVSPTVAGLAATGTAVKWYSASTGGTALTTNTALATGNYYVSQTVTGCESATRAVAAVTVNTNPSAPTTESQSFCSAAAPTVAGLTATTGTAVKWYSAATGGTALATTTALASGNYYASQTVTGCESTTRATTAITVNTNPSAPTATAQTFCSGTAPTVEDLATTTGTAVKWYSSSTGGSALSAITALATGNYYASQTVSGCESTTRTVTAITVNTTPTAPATAAQAFCSANTPMVDDLATITGSAVKWYTASTGGSALSTSAALATGNYYASQTVAGCESTTRTLTAVTVNTTPTAPETAAQAFCSANAPMVDDLSATTGTAVQWYSASSGGSALSSSAALATGNYYASQTVSGCESTTRALTAITVNTNPSAPTSAAQIFCSASAATVANLTAAGTAVQWYSASIGGSAISTSAALATGNYYASQTVSGCESTTRTLTAVTVNTTPSAPTAAAQEFCAASLPTVANLAAQGTAVKWYSAATGGSSLSTTTALVTGTYFASQTVNGCESATRTSVAVTLSTPIAGTVTASATSICTGTSSLLTLTGSDGTIQWQVSTTSTGTFTDISGATSNTYNAAGLTSTRYYRAKVSKSSCAAVYTLVRSIAVTTVPSVGGTLSSDITICTGTGTTLTLAGYTGTILWYYSTNWTASTPTWTALAGTTASLATGNLTASRAYRAKLTSGSCITYSNQVLVTVTPAAATSVIAGSGSKCINSTVNLSLTTFTGAIQWQEGTSATGTFTNINGANSSTYTIDNLTSTRYFRVVVTSGVCSSVTSAVATVTCSPLSVAGAVTFTGLSEVCPGSTKSLSVTGSVGSTQWESSLDNVTYTAISGAISTTYVASPTVATYYRVKKTSGTCSAVYTTPVYLTISTPSAGGNIGSDITVCGTTGTTLNLVGSSGTIAWQMSANFTATTPTWTTLAGQTNASLATGALSSSRAYKAKLTSGSCISYSNTVIVTMNPALVTKSITSTTTSGTTALTALCTNDLTKVLNLGTGSVGNIQWQVSIDNGTTYTDIVGATAATYTVGAPVAGKNMFRVKLSNACGVVYSSNVFTVYYTTCAGKSITNTIETSFAAVAYPNPFADNFMLEVSASTNEMIQVNVYDMLGKLVENHNVKVSDLSTFVIGNKFVSGVYNIEVIQGTQIERLRVVKN